MKNDVRVSARSAVESLLTSYMPNLIPVRVGKRNCYAISTGVNDEEGRPVYATIAVTVCNTSDTETTTAFNLDEAMTARAEADNAPKKEKKAAEPDPEAEARKEARKAQEAIVEEWCLANLSDTPMTATDIQAAIPELASLQVMQVGSYLKNIAARNERVRRAQEKGKWYYTLD